MYRWITKRCSWMAERPCTHGSYTPTHFSCVAQYLHTGRTAPREEAIFRSSCFGFPVFLLGLLDRCALGRSNRIVHRLLGCTLFSPVEHTAHTPRRHLRHPFLSPS